jgi:hypothetical protein
MRPEHGQQEGPWLESKAVHFQQKWKEMKGTRNRDSLLRSTAEQTRLTPLFREKADFGSELFTQRELPLEV